MTYCTSYYSTNLEKEVHRMLFRHYGTNKFDPKKVKTIENYLSSKPKGGFWAAPAEDDPWKHWSLTEDYRTEKLNRWVDFKLTPSAKVLVIAEPSDLNKIPCGSLRGLEFRVFDFEPLRDKYDAMYVDYNHGVETAEGCFFYPYDVNSLCVWNPDVIQIVNSSKRR